ncbi:hypothetical protein SAMN05443429_11263 [Cruoricaptor ignavus]|uniref:Uncharacterized protein n=1 Tax=Cruoricaptor ignavus TaxID=1118202 RepID=A0A1M6HHQ7_9FLAO|nr:hypothetical protein [Cruoricaptor ignavus]SHJ21629.1 hypothetical protein SAMN05443429_11263 [Cruoricaptor ignavus]
MTEQELDLLLGEVKTIKAFVGQVEKKLMDIRGGVGTAHGNPKRKDREEIRAKARERMFK